MWQMTSKQWVNINNSNDTKQSVKLSDEDGFIDGSYFGSFHEYGSMEKLSMKRFNLTFTNNNNDEETVNGQGTDCIGFYHINGIYSSDTNRMALNKTYLNDKDEEKAIMRVRVKWNGKDKFKGHWIMTSSHGSKQGKWMIKRCRYNNNESVTNKYTTVDLEECC